MTAGGRRVKKKGGETGPLVVAALCLAYSRKRGRATKDEEEETGPLAVAGPKPCVHNNGGEEKGNERGDGHVEQGEKRRAKREETGLMAVAALSLGQRREW
ncbi:hypothetical protein AMTR_s00108p00083320 [Amborella trichopoda]|uniref:Uncharacterized protein n=1 Tax=Amborella trichopoda TaxID=13333 RepID=W1NVN3_AMBTC|nr:hypothetical protein AMTR_s00108p00083320 [Amborella trichopoda]